jgi:P pilus assembly chaperone PapD
MANFIGKTTLSLLFNCFIFTTFNTDAVSISTKRLYLTPKNDTASIYVVNSENNTQRCQLSIRDTRITDDSFIELLPAGEVAATSAANFIRFAPRRFELGPKQNQNVKLVYRRRPGNVNGEHKGLFAIKCETLTKNAKSKELVTLEAIIVHNVPVIVQTGDLKVNAAFGRVKLTDNRLEVNIDIEGNRAITGDLELVDESSGEILAFKKDMTIYWESPTRQVFLSLENSVTGPAIIRFTEDPNFGGDLLIEYPIK